jgi:curved DNA-binding protein CbpA
MNIRYFQSKNLQDLRNEYRRLAKKYHPDLGGDTEIMKVINLEYEYLSKTLSFAQAKAEGWSNFKREYHYNVCMELRDLINKVIRIPDITIEIIGSWLWITGTTKPQKEYFKGLGMQFSFKKQAWFYHVGEYHKFDNRRYSLDQIRNMFGSQKIENENQMQIENQN